MNGWVWLVEILALFLPDEYRVVREPQYPAQRDRPSPFHVFLTDPALNRRLVPALLDLYCDIEAGPNQYYEKFNTRYVISLLLEFLWQCPTHRQALTALAALSVAPPSAAAAAASSSSSSAAAAATSALTGGYGTGETFTRFVNFILNDFNFLLDESLRALSRIRDEQLERKNEQKWRAQPPSGLSASLPPFPPPLLANAPFLSPVTCGVCVGRC
jgi:hypothetical protein